MQQININFSNARKILALLFFMSITSIFSSLSMDHKLYQRQKNNNQLEELKSRFVLKRKQLMESKRKIMISAENFGFDVSKKNIVIINNE